MTTTLDYNKKDTFSIKVNEDYKQQIEYAKKHPVLLWMSKIVFLICLLVVTFVVVVVALISGITYHIYYEGKKMKILKRMWLTIKDYTKKVFFICLAILTFIGLGALLIVGLIYQLGYKIKG